MTTLLLSLLLSQEGEHYKHLKRIEWIVGTWAGKGEMPGFGAYEDEFVLEWAYNKNFIRNSYVLKAGGKAVWTDTGLIGWDPEKRKIVGINFGMDGTIGWGREVEGEMDSFAVEGRTAGPVVKEEFRAVIRKAGDREMTMTIEYKKDDKYVPQGTTKYVRKDFTLSKVPENAKAQLNYEHLKGLEFLAGRWSGKGEGAQGPFEIDYAFEWTLNKNFLVRTVSARAMGQVVWSATEWIGWDVDRKQIVVIGFGHDGSLRVAWAVEAKENVLVTEGTQGTRKVRLSHRRTGDTLSVLTERHDGASWLSDKKIDVNKIHR